jgi:hypothetical protein
MNGGDAIRQTQAKTGARIQVSSEPLGNSTDKTVTISGTPEVVETAVRKVLTQLAELESPLKGKRVRLCDCVCLVDWFYLSSAVPSPT